MKKWYVVQVASGGEEMFRKDLFLLIQGQPFESLLGDIAIPTRKKSREDEVAEKVFPGYVLINAEMESELESFVSRVPRFSRFVGGRPPVALSEKEVKGIFDNENRLLKKEVSVFAAGTELKVVGGPFSGFLGIVESVEAEKQKVRLSVSIFGRMTSVVVDLDQVEVHA